jgi:putative peptidoglycan lipid II flippase
LQRQPLIQAAGLLYSVSLIGSVLWLTPILGPISAAIGAAVSFVLMFIVVLVATLSIARRPVSQFVPRAMTRKDHASVTIVTLASIVSYGQVLVAPVIASTLGQGAVAQLSFAFRPVEVLVRGLPSVISYSVMPGIAAARGRGDQGQVTSAISEAMRLTLVLMLPIAALLAAVRTPLVTILYQRAAFSADAVRAVAPTLGWYAAALPVFSLLVVLNVVLLTIGRERLALAMGVGVLATYCVLGLTLGRMFGGSGVALGFCVANVVVGMIGLVARGRQALGEIMRSSWFHWIVAGALFAFVIGDAAVELTRSLPVLVQLVAGLVFGGLGATIGVARAEAHSLTTARAWLTAVVLAPLRQRFERLGA